ncbi:hypothetical protein AVEN_245390-1 [Araneus ventricosus]|uniref:Uncharacterized protein n=1 Tax=Araneus ventricosus TaxID=182803 RepID=A0A4Y2M5P4_ARAVE|nr:hypothetical protein AVEN_245390-1 [Araneus ventricosus]
MIDSTSWKILISKERKPSKFSRTSKESQAAIGLSLRHTEGLHKTVAERILPHGSSAWCLSPTYRMKKKTFSIKRPFLFNISGVFRTTPTAALRTILGISPLNMQLQFEDRFTSIYLLRISLPSNITDIKPHDLEMKTTGWSLNPSEHLQPNQISYEEGEENIAQKDIINIFPDGAKTGHGVGADFSVLTNDIWTHKWSAKLKTTTPYFNLNSQHFMKQ